MVLVIFPPRPLFGALPCLDPAALPRNTINFRTTRARAAMAEWANLFRLSKIRGRRDGNLEPPDRAAVRRAKPRAAVLRAEPCVRPLRDARLQSGAHGGGALARAHRGEPLPGRGHALRRQRATGRRPGRPHRLLLGRRPTPAARGERNRCRRAAAQQHLPAARQLSPDAAHRTAPGRAALGRHRRDPDRVLRRGHGRALVRRLPLGQLRAGRGGEDGAERHLPPAAHRTARLPDRRRASTSTPSAACRRPTSGMPSRWSASSWRTSTSR